MLVTAKVDATNSGYGYQLNADAMRRANVGQDTPSNASQIQQICAPSPVSLNSLPATTSDAGSVSFDGITVASIAALRHVQDMNQQLLEALGN